MSCFSSCHFHTSLLSNVFCVSNHYWLIYSEYSFCLFVLQYYFSTKWIFSYTFTDEFKSFMRRLPNSHFLSIGAIHQHWGNDWELQNRYKLLQSSLEIQRQKMQHTARKLFGLSLRCRHNPNHQLPRER